MGEYDKKLKEVVVGLLKENTGRHMLDSGGAYGRHWERNQNRDFESEPSVTTEISGDEETGEVKEVMVTYNLYHFLVNFLYLDGDTDFVNEEFMKVAHSEEMEHEAWEDCLNAYIKKVKGKYKYGEYTYNRGGEVLISQDIVYHFVELPTEPVTEGNATIVNTEDFLVIQIHNGCDARGGFTSPYIFKCGDEGYFNMAMSQVTAFCTGKTEELNVEKGDLFNSPEVHCENVWDSDDGGYSYHYEGPYDYNDRSAKSRKEFNDLITFDAENNCIRCKDCGGKIEFYVMESY